MIPEYIFMALQTLRANPLRTLLSTLGVVIGVGALVSILALADGLEAFSREQIETTTDLQVISISSVTSENVDGVLLRRREYPVFVPADAESLAARLGDSAAVGISTSYAGFWGLPGDTLRLQAIITAATPATLDLLGARLVAGRHFSDADVASGARLAIVSRGIAKRLAENANQSLDKSIVIGEERYTITGVGDGNTAEETFGRIAIPLVAPSALPGATDARPPTITARAYRVEDVPSVRAAMEHWLAQSWDTSGRRFVVTSNVARVEQARRAMTVFKLAMGAIAGISLLVGGIGIMNVLLASVTERTREIGIRRASGARRGDIRRQFLAESVAISAVGSALGAALGMAMSVIALAVISNLTGAEVRAVFAWQSVAFAVGAALVVGLVFGLYPALRAARLPPIEALRHE